MAVKNHELDGKIIEAARHAFLEDGFLNASLHRIARDAGITTGALYTRYRGKDDLFRSLVGDVFGALRERAPQVAPLYAHAAETRDIQDFLKAMRAEARMIVEVFYENYLACLLLFCRAEGSAASEELEAIFSKKISETVAFWERLSPASSDGEAVRLLLECQLEMYRRLLDRCAEREEGIRRMRLLIDFMEAGWLRLYSG